MEIERKYAISNLPGALSQYRYKKIEQGYLCRNPVVRIRKSNDDYILTYKSKFGLEQQKENGPLIHNEVELPLTEEAYLTLRDKIEGNILYKTRYLIPLKDKLTVELDVFEGPLKGLMFAEVEFPDEETADKFSPPSWFGKELSSDRRYSNYRLSKLTEYNESDFA
ncbi:MAG: CYTH domain-containing protein [Mobilitalea sp.]